MATNKEHLQYLKSLTDKELELLSTITDEAKIINLRLEKLTNRIKKLLDERALMFFDNDVISIRGDIRIIRSKVLGSGKDVTYLVVVTPGGIVCEELIGYAKPVPIGHLFNKIISNVDSLGGFKTCISEGYGVALWDLTKYNIAQRQEVSPDKNTPALSSGVGVKISLASWGQPCVLPYGIKYVHELQQFFRVITKKEFVFPSKFFTEPTIGGTLKNNSCQSKAASQGFGGSW